MRTLSWIFTALAAVALVLNWTHGLNINIFWSLLFLSPIINGHRLLKKNDSLRKETERLSDYEESFNELVRICHIPPHTDEGGHSWMNERMKNMSLSQKLESSSIELSKLRDQLMKYDALRGKLSLAGVNASNMSVNELAREIERMNMERRENKIAINDIRMRVLEDVSDDEVAKFALMSMDRDPKKKEEAERELMKNVSPYKIRNGVKKLVDGMKEEIEQLHHEKRNLLEKLRDKSN